MNMANQTLEFLETAVDLMAKVSKEFGAKTAIICLFTIQFKSKLG
jgi:hypothetical protein